jgi:hypothetical protein
MIYVKANVERIVNDANEAQKLIAQGFKAVEEKTVEKPVEKPVEEEAPKRRRRR